MAVRKYTDEEINRIIEVINQYPGNYTYAARMLSSELNRSTNAIIIKFREVKHNYDTPIIVSPSGIKTPNGVTRWISGSIPEFTTVRRWNNIKHLFF